MKCVLAEEESKSWCVSAPVAHMLWCVSAPVAHMLTNQRFLFCACVQYLPSAGLPLPEVPQRSVCVCVCVCVCDCVCVCVTVAGPAMCTPIWPPGSLWRRLSGRAWRRSHPRRFTTLPGPPRSCPTWSFFLSFPASSCRPRQARPHRHREVPRGRRARRTSSAVSNTHAHPLQKHAR